MENSVMLNAVCHKPVSLKVLEEPFYRKGFSPFVNKETGTWWEYDDDKKGFFDTGIIAQGRDGDTVDVYIDGKSIVQDGVANIPMARDEILGAVCVRADFGIGINENNGLLYTETAADLNIKNRQSRKVIAPTNFDYAVKCAMTDGIGAEWTADEQAAARERIGISGYELVCDVTLEEAIDDFVRDTYSDGTPYNLSKALVFINVPVQESGYVPGTCWIYFKDSNKFNAGRLYYSLKSSVNREFIFKAEQITSNGVWSLPTGECGQEYLASTRMNVYNTKIRISNICAVQITCSLPQGTTIQIYGVRE